MGAVPALLTHLGPPIQSQSSPGDFQGGQGQQLHFLTSLHTGRPSHQLQLRDPQHQRGDFGQSSKCLYFSFQKRFIQLPVADPNKVRRSPNFKDLSSYFSPDQAATTDLPPRSDRKTSLAKSRTTPSVTETKLRNQHLHLLLIDLPFLLLGGSKLPPILPLACARGDDERGEGRRRRSKMGRS